MDAAYLGRGAGALTGSLSARAAQLKGLAQGVWEKKSSKIAAPEGLLMVGKDAAGNTLSRASITFPPSTAPKSNEEECRDLLAQAASDGSSL